MIAALVPVKLLSQSKQRLSDLLQPEQRQKLCLAMLEDVISVLSKQPQLDRVVVVSSDPQALRLSEQYSVEFINETVLETHGLNGVVSVSAAILATQGVDSLLVVHGDLPFISSAGLGEFLAASRDLQPNSLVIATDNAGCGSNCLLISPPTALSFQYGEGSCEKHQRQALEKGLKVQAGCFNTLSCDVDNEADLRRLARCLDSGVGRQTAHYLRSSGLAEWLAGTEYQ